MELLKRNIGKISATPNPDKSGGGDRPYSRATKQRGFLSSSLLAVFCCVAVFGWLQLPTPAGLANRIFVNKDRIAVPVNVSNVAIFSKRISITNLAPHEHGLFFIRDGRNVPIGELSVMPNNPLRALNHSPSLSSHFRINQPSPVPVGAQNIGGNRYAHVVRWRDAGIPNYDVRYVSGTIGENLNFPAHYAEVSAQLPLGIFFPSPPEHSRVNHQSGREGGQHNSDIDKPPLGRRIAVLALCVFLGGQLFRKGGQYSDKDGIVWGSLFCFAGFLTIYLGVALLFLTSDSSTWGWVL